MGGIPFQGDLIESRNSVNNVVHLINVRTSSRMSMKKIVNRICISDSLLVQSREKKHEFLCKQTVAFNGFARVH